MDVIYMDDTQPENEMTQKTTEQTFNEKIKNCKCYRQADVLDQTRLRALTLSFTEPLFKRFGS